MSSDLQLSLDAFDRTRPPLCDGFPDHNGFISLCCRCPFAVREGSAVFCEEFGVPIRARAKYGLRGWREVRTAVIDRDGGVCTVCGSVGDLHVHHLDLDPTNDDPSNLVTLCGICHARVHSELRREGGAGRVARVIPAIRRSTEPDPDQPGAALTPSPPGTVSPHRYSPRSSAAAERL